MMSDERLAEIERHRETVRAINVVSGVPEEELEDELLAEVHRLRRELDRYRDAGAVVESRERYEGE